jgi:hypothetical protein
VDVQVVNHPVSTILQGSNPLFYRDFIDSRQGISTKNANSAISAKRASGFSKSPYLWVVQVN